MMSVNFRQHEKLVVIQIIIWYLNFSRVIFLGSCSIYFSKRMDTYYFPVTLRCVSYCRVTIKKWVFISKFTFGTLSLNVHSRLHSQKHSKNINSCSSRILFASFIFWNKLIRIDRATWIVSIEMWNLKFQ